jgi:rhodanese-related sulfurtransferase
VAQNVRVNPFDVPTVSLDEVPPGGVILDVREPYEWTAGHIEGARHIPMNSIPATVTHQPDGLTPDERIHVICAMGGRSAHVAAWLIQNGFDAVNVAGGMHAWEGSGRPMVSESGDAPTVV